MLYDPDKVIWFHTEDRKVHPREGILRLLAKGISLDAVVCYNDQIAMQIIPALASRGIRVPEDEMAANKMVHYLQERKLEVEELRDYVG